MILLNNRVKVKKNNFERGLSNFGIFDKDINEGSITLGLIKKLEDEIVEKREEIKFIKSKLTNYGKHNSYVIL